MPPRYESAARLILPGWELSLAFVAPATARRLNKKLRNKSYVPNVLAYQAGERHGEVIICREVAKKQAASYQMSVSKFTLYLFIHGCLHLAGLRHGATMERREQALLAKLGTATRSSPHAPHRHRNRHRDLPGQDRRRRRTSR